MRDRGWGGLRGRAFDDGYKGREFKSHQFIFFLFLEFISFLRKFEFMLYFSTNSGQSFEVT